MDKRKFSIPALVLLVSASAGFSSTASAVDYTYGEIRFLLDAEADFDNNVNADGDGIRFGGSFKITNEFYAFASYDDADLEANNVDVDFSLFRLGGGYIYPINPTWDANFALAYAKAEADAGNNNEDENGVELTAGVRGMIKPEIEVRGELNYLDLDDSDTYFTLGGDYYFTPNVSAGLELDLGGDYETMSIGAKYYFK